MAKTKASTILTLAYIASITNEAGETTEQDATLEVPIRTMTFKLRADTEELRNGMTLKWQKIDDKYTREAADLKVDIGNLALKKSVESTDIIDRFNCDMLKIVVDRNKAKVEHIALIDQPIEGDFYGNLNLEVLREQMLAFRIASGL